MGIGCADSYTTDLAAITAGYLTVYYLAGGVGSAIGGGIWTNTVQEKIREYMNNDTLAASAYANPLCVGVCHRRDHNMCHRPIADILLTSALIS